MFPDRTIFHQFVSTICRIKVHSIQIAINRSVFNTMIQIAYNFEAAHHTHSLISHNSRTSSFLPIFLQQMPYIEFVAYEMQINWIVHESPITFSSYFSSPLFILLKSSVRLFRFSEQYFLLDSFRCSSGRSSNALLLFSIEKCTNPSEVLSIN